MSDSTTTMEKRSEKVRSIDLAAVISLTRKKIQTLGLEQCLNNTIADCIKSGSKQKMHIIGKKKMNINIVDVVEAFRQSNEGSIGILVTKPLDKESLLSEELIEWCGKRGWFLGMNLTLIIPICTSTKLEVLMKVEQRMGDEEQKSSRIISYTNVSSKKKRDEYIISVKNALNAADSYVQDKTDLFKDDFPISIKVQPGRTSATLMLLETFLNKGDIEDDKDELVDSYFNAIISHELNEKNDRILACEVDDCCNKWCRVPVVIATHYEKKPYCCTYIGRKCCKYPHEAEANTHDGSIRKEAKKSRKRSKPNIAQTSETEMVVYKNNILPEESERIEMEFEKDKPKPSSGKDWFEELPQWHVFCTNDLSFTEETRSGLKDLFNKICFPVTDMERLIGDKLIQTWGKKTAKTLQRLFHPDKNQNNPAAAYFSKRINELNEMSGSEIQGQWRAFEKAKQKIVREDMVWEKEKKSFIKRWLIKEKRLSVDVDLTNNDEDDDYIDLVGSSDEEDDDSDDMSIQSLVGSPENIAQPPGKDDNVAQCPGADGGKLVACASNEEEDFNFLSLGYNQGPATEDDFNVYCPSCLRKHNMKNIHFNNPDGVESEVKKKIQTHANTHDCHPYIGYIYRKDKEPTRNFHKLKCFVLSGRVKKHCFKMDDAKNMATLTDWTEKFFCMDTHINDVLSRFKKNKVTLSDEMIEKLKKSLESNPDAAVNGWKPVDLKLFMKKEFRTLKNNLLNQYKTDTFKMKWINAKPKAVFVNDMNAALSSVYHYDTSPNVFELVETSSFPDKWL